MVANQRGLTTSVPNLKDGGVSPTPPSSPMLTPICSKTTSVSTSTSVTAVHQETATTSTMTTCIPQNESTPIHQANSILTKYVSEQQIHQHQHFSASRLSRTQTPSPSFGRRTNTTTTNNNLYSNYNQQYTPRAKQYNNVNSNSAEAPPRPPRRPSLKCLND